MKAQFDVAAIAFKTLRYEGEVTQEANHVIWVDGPYDAQNADAVIKMAVMRQGVDDRFFAACQHGQYKKGEKWEGGVTLPLEPEDPDYVTVGGTRYPRGKRGL